MKVLFSKIFGKKHLAYVQALTESQWYIATCDQLELAVTLSSQMLPQGFVTSIQCI